MPAGTVLVIRATGAQGVGVVKNLLSKDFIVHAFVRDVTDERSTALKAMGAILFEGSLDNPEAMARASEDITGVFFNLMPSFTDESAEIRQANSILEITKTAGAKHVVYSSALRVGRWDESEHWDPSSSISRAILGKVKTEKLVRESPFQTWTILKPGYFMTNFLAPLGEFMFPGISKAEFVSSYHPDTILPLVDPNDIGAFATSAFLDPKKFGGQEVQIVSEKIVVEEVVHLLEEAARKPIKTIYRTAEETDALKGNPLIAGQILTLDMHKYADMENIKKWGIPLGSFREFLKNEHDQVDATFDPTLQQVTIPLVSEITGSKEAK